MLGSRNGPRNSCTKRNVAKALVYGSVPAPELSSCLLLLNPAIFEVPNVEHQGYGLVLNAIRNQLRARISSLFLAFF